MDKYKRLMLGLLLCSTLTTFAQHDAAHAEEHNAQGSLRISAAMGHAFIKKGLNKDLRSDVTSAAAVALDADYWFLKKWAVGVHSDLVFENFLVEEKTGAEETDFIEREYPLAVVPVVMFSPVKHVTLIGGVGQEFSKEKNLTLYRGGAEYGFELPNHWELSLSAMYDVKHKSYDTWMLGFGVSKWLGLSHKSRQHAGKHS
ncbi:MAG: hypothetical protein QM727_07730 [Niabella sp.]